MDSAEANDRRQLKLLLVASRHHLSRGDIRSLIEYLEREDFGFNVALDFSNPSENPELLELYRLVALPALIKLEPSPRQIFAGSSIFEQVKTWVPRWQHERINNRIGVSLRGKTIEPAQTQKELLLEDDLLVLRQENETLTKKIHSQESLLRMVAHELRTPLTAAGLALQSQKLGQISMNKFQDVLKRRLQEIEILSKDLLEVGSTRWETLFNPQKVDLASISAEAILELEKQWFNRKIKINTDIPTDLPSVFADQRRMMQVLLNLIENALKFSEDEGEIFITMLHRTNQWVEVIVRDNGPGIPQEEQQRIFVDRVRLPQTSQETTGFGIGLSVCRRIVEVHGGKIWVVSKPTEGACFYFTVPVWRGQDKVQEALTSGKAGP